MHTSLAAIILVSCVIPAADSSPSTSENYRVSEVVSSLSPNSFQCKLDNYKPAPSVRFRVCLPDTEGLTKEALTARLKSAKEIELRNIKFRNYFRVEAEVWIDGQLFLKKPASKTTQNDNDIRKQPANITPSQFPATHRWQQPPLSSGGAEARPVTVRRVHVATSV
ncbi:MAG: hypothetical protein ACYSOZ_07080, partial [Planctomycetota bacterium]